MKTLKWMTVVICLVLVWALVAGITAFQPGDESYIILTVIGLLVFAYLGFKVK